MESPIVGRSRERAILLGRVDDLMAGTGGLVLIEGEPGIGKSRMVEDLIDSADWRGARVLSAAHTELSRLRPYQGLYDALSPATTGLRGEHLAEVIDQVWLQNASEVFPDLRQFLSESTIRRALRPEEEPSRMNEALARVLLAQGGLGPTVIILEDVHWCDDDSMQVFANIGERLSRSGVLICLTYRRFEAEQAQEVWSVISNLEASTAVSRVVLGLLNNAEAREIITDQVGPGVLPNRVIEQLVEDSGGNPLYLREALRDPEALLRSEDAMALPHEDSGNFPATVARALHQRLAVLPDHVRTVIQAIAVLAEPCSSQLVAKITGLDRRQTLGGLNEAVSRGFLVELGDGICRFNHDQTRRAIYHAVDEDEILGWHHQIFQALAASDDPQPEQLAYHADLAQMWHQASQWHTVAARAAQEVNAFGVAAEHYRQADEAAKLAEVPIIDRIADLLDYEQVLDVLGRREDQQDLLKRLLDLDLPLESQVDLAERQAWLLGHIDRHDEAAHLATEWADRAFDAGLPTYRLLSALGVVRYWSGSHLEAIDALRRALKAAPDDQSRVTIENHLGRTLIDMSEFDEGNELVADARAKAERLGDVRSQVESLIHQSISAVRRGQPTEAIEYAEQSLPLSRSIGYRYGEGVSLVNLANIRSGQGRAGMALPMYGEAAEVFDSLGNARAKAIIRFNLGEFYHSFLGENDEAATFFNSAAAYCKAVGDQRTEMLAMSKISSIDWQSGRRRLARQRLKRLIERSIEIGDTHVELEARRIAAECASSADEPEEAIEQLDLAIKLIEENAMGQVHAHALAHRGLATLRAGDDEEAIEYVERSALANTPESEFGLITAWRCGIVFKAVGRDKDAAAQFDLAFRLLESNLTGLEPERAASARTLPQFAAIIEAYELEFVRQVEINLPSIEAPIGRTLEPNEYETVTWTVSTPADWDHSVASTRRRNRISRLCAEAVEQEAVARIYDLATVLSVSERTIKRDLSELRAMGESPKTRRSA